MICYGIAVTCRTGKILAKNYGVQVQTPNQVCCRFFRFGSLVFLEIAYGDSFQQCLNTNRGKIYEKKFGPKFGPEVSKSVQKQVSYYFLKWGLLVFFEILCNGSWQQCLARSRGNILENTSGTQIQAQNQVFLLFSEVWFISFT